MFPYPPVRVWVLLCLMIVGATANLLAIDRLVPQEYATIQEAIVAAQTGDVVLVSPGTYSELIDFLGKTIAVRSTDGPAVTIIDGGGSGPIVTFQNLEGPGSVLEGFTITNGVAAEGAGITILDAYPTILNNTISSNTATAGSGGGILMRNYTPNIDVTLIPRIAGNIISDNMALTFVGGGGGLYVYSGYEFPKLENNQWTGNALQSPINYTFGEGSTIYARTLKNNPDVLHINNDVINVPEWTGNSGVPSSIHSVGVNLLIEDSQVQVHNSNDWGGGLKTAYYWDSPNAINKIEINSTSFSTFGPASATSQPLLARIRDTENLLLNNVTLNSSGAFNPRFETYLYQGSSTVHSKNLISEGVDLYFGSGYQAQNNTEIIDTQITSGRFDVFNYDNLNNDINISGLLVNGTHAHGDRVIDVYAGGYFYDMDTSLTISNVTAKDMLIEDSGVGVLNVQAWGNRSADIEINNVKIEGVESQPNLSNTLVNVFASNYYYQDLSANISLDNVLLVNPTSASRPMVIAIESTYGGGYSETYTLDTSIDIRNTTITGEFGTDSSIVIQQDLDPEHTTSVNISDSIVEGPIPFSTVPASTADLGATISMQHSMTTVPVEGIGNQIGQAIFTQGPLGDFYLAQIPAGNLQTSPGVDAGDPDSSAPFLGGTRSDGGLDTGTPDIGFHYSTRSEFSTVNLEVDDAAIFFEPGTGLIDSDVISLYLQETIAEGNSPTSWRGISLRLLQESGSLQIATVDVADDLLTALGSPPEYFEALICDDVVTVGLIASLSDPNLTFTISPTTEIFQLGLVAGSNLATSTEIIETQWIPQDGPGCGGLLDVTNVVSDAGGNITPIQRRPLSLTLVPRPLFIRGDANTDGQTDLGDAVALLSFLFNGLGQLGCHDAADVNDDGQIDVADPIALLAALFTAGSPPPAPGQSCGPDPTADLLRCESYEVCTPTVSLTSFSVTPTEPGVVQLSWETAGPVDQFQISNNGIVHQRLAGTATGSEIRSLPPGLQDVCLWVLAEGQIIEQCLSVFTSEPVVDLTCQMDTLSPDAILEWVPQPGIDQLEIYSGTDLLAVVDADDLLAQISVPPTGLQNFCLIGVTGQIVSAPLCCKVQGNDECYGAVPLTLGDHSIPFEASTTSQDAYDSGQCLSCWNSSPETFFTANGGDVWYSYEAEQSGVLLFDYSADMVIYEGDCSALTQKYCGFGVMRQVEAGDQFLIRLGGWIGSNINFNLAYIDTLPPPFIYHCSQGFDSNSGLYRVSWGVGGPNNYYELMTVTVDGVEVGTVPGTDGTFLIPGLISGNTYEICITGQTGSLISPAACQTVTIP